MKLHAIALVLLAGTAYAEAPRFEMRMVKQRPLIVSQAADSHIIFMNSCRPNGCPVKVGNTDSRVDTSDIASQNGTLAAWSYGQTSWDSVMSCMRTTFSRWNVQIVDVDPGTTPHYEVMVAGSPQTIMGSQGFGVGGIADFPCDQVGQCDPYIPNALVFAFASVFGNNPTEICAVAAQEIAHTWALDHVVDPMDPLTYNSFNGMRQYHDNEKCGSDCQGGQSPFGLTCTGTGGQATHLCSGTGTATQNEVQMISALFGPSGPPTPPHVAITMPVDGASVSNGFRVTADLSDDSGIAKAELRIDGNLIGTVNAPPFTWTAPASVGQGNHTISVTGYDVFDAMAETHIQVALGSPCAKAKDCSNETDVCVDGHCVPGSGATGGLGTTCTSNADCVSGQCGSDGSGNMFCVETCDPSLDACPSGYDCIAGGGAGGVCWPGGDDGGGCNSGPGQGLVFGGMMFVALLLLRRRATS